MKYTLGHTGPLSLKGKNRCVSAHSRKVLWRQEGTFHYYSDCDPLRVHRLLGTLAVALLSASDVLSTVLLRVY